MSRFMLALVAAATAAVAAVAVIALPAIGDDSSPDVDAFATCLRAHGLPGAPSDPTALKPWIAGRQADNPLAVKRAMVACDHTLPDKPDVSERGPDANTVIACVRRHGIDAPTDPLAFKQWLGRQLSTDSSSVRDALDACKLSLDPGTKPGAPKCVAPDEKPPADKPQGDKPQGEKPPAQSAPPAEDDSV
jgi:hypothetical protein